MSEGSIPPRPSGTGPYWNFAQKVWDRVFGPAGRIISTDTVKVGYTSRGITLTAAAAGPTNVTTQGGSQPTGKLGTYVSSFGDYIVLQDVTGHLVPVAKVYLHRNSITGMVIEGNGVSYLYPGTGSLIYMRRTAVEATIQYIEGITPPFVSGNQIRFSQTADATGVSIQTGDTTLYGNPPTAYSPTAIAAGVPVIYMDENRDGRAWAVLANQSGEGS